MTIPRLTRNLREGTIPNGFALQQYSEITDAELRILAEFPWSILQLDCTKITDERLLLVRSEEARRQRPVEQLDLWSAGLLTDAAIESIAWLFGSVKVLGLEGCTTCSNNGLVHCADINGLTDLSLDGWTTDGAGLEYLRRVPRLAKLTVSTHVNFDSTNLRHLSGTRLVALCLMYSKVRMEDLSLLLAIPGLADLDLTAIDLDDSGLEAVTGIGGLEALKFEQTKRVTDAGFAKLARLTRLKSLITCSPLVTDTSAAVVVELPHLEKLRFSEAAITDRTVELLPRCPKLSWLTLQECKGVTDGAVNTLATMTGLKRLALRGTSLTPQAVGGLRASLKHCDIRYDG